LRQTLDAIATVDIPEDMPCELVVVDNDSTDETAEVVRSFKITHMPLRYVHEPRKGQNYAYNTAMAVARGEVFLFTDDDVRPPRNWIEGMCRPIVSGAADVIAGGVSIAPHLERPWMEMPHRTWLASTDWSAVNPDGIVGANMAISRRVLLKVPSFDTELGPGALGFGGETLFFLQLKRAGYRTGTAFDVAVEHHFDESRLSRQGLLDRLAMAGRMFAYLDYHWEHRIIPYPRLRLMKGMMRLAYQRLRRRQEVRASEGMPVWEMFAVSGVYFYKQYLIERKRPHNYEKHGLVKLNGGALSPKPTNRFVVNSRSLAP
jgi:glycosyltransferase involved in cell wall biosynthesis